MRKIFLASMLFAASAFAADVTGNWSGDALSEGQTHPMYFVLKQDGNTLTGTGGPDQSEQHPMQNGKIDGGKITFEVPAGKATFHFEFSLDGAALKGTVQVKSDEASHSGTISIKRVA